MRRQACIIFMLALGAAVAGGPDLEPARERIRAGGYAEAERYLAALQVSHPDDIDILLMRGEVLLALRRPADAIRLLERGTRLEPNQPKAHFQLATALSAAGQPDRALENYGREIEINGDGRVRRMAHLNRALLFRQQRAWSMAAAEIEAVLLLDPGGLDAYGDLAGIYLQAGDLEEVARVLERGDAAGFRSARLRHDLGLRLSGLHAHDDARRAFEHAVRVDPDFAEAHRSLAECLDRLGRYRDAVQHFERYLALDPDSDHAPRVRERLHGGP